MRCLKRHRAARGMTLIELLVTLAIGGLLVMAGVPYYVQYSHNTRLREAGNTLMTEALYTQSEAVKRNANISMVISGSSVDVRDVGTDSSLRLRRWGDGVTAEAATTIVFGGQGRPVPFGTASSVNLVLSGQVCSNDVRCPGLRVDGGGGIRLCANTQSC